MMVLPVTDAKMVIFVTFLLIMKCFAFSDNTKNSLGAKTSPIKCQINFSVRNLSQVEMLMAFVELQVNYLSLVIIIVERH